MLSQILPFNFHCLFLLPSIIKSFSLEFFSSLSIHYYVNFFIKFKYTTRSAFNKGMQPKDLSGRCTLNQHSSMHSFFHQIQV